MGILSEESSSWKVIEEKPTGNIKSFPTFLQKPFLSGFLLLALFVQQQWSHWTVW